MSGFAGIVNLDGAPVDDRLLRRMAGFMEFRGPNRQQTWHGGAASLAYALLRTTHEAAGECQPLTLDGETWVVADARLDARVELVVRLGAAGESASRDAPDVELLLRAYRAWGDHCVDHLIGDFAFAVWDAPRRRLFCGRDQLGVKSFFYTVIGRTVVFSNTLDCVRLHPDVSDRLNDLAVADFLLFELNQDPATSVYADIRRLPPAHTAAWSPAGGLQQRYWTLPVEEPVFYRRAEDYVERFTELLNLAVSDRLRTDCVGIFMSGGLDSTALAAVASRVLRRDGHEQGVKAFTTTLPGLDRDEGRYARLVAERLRIPIALEEGGRAAFDPEWPTRAIHTPSPIRDVTTLDADRRAYSRMALHAPVAFYGEGPDNALHYEWQPYLRYLRARRRYVRLAGDVARHVRSHRRLPLQSIVARMLRARRDRGRWDIPYPAWIDPALERRLDLRERWEAVHNPPAPDVVHPVRPAAYASFTGLEWEALFRGFDPEETGSALDVRHPYVDLRLLRYLLSVPPVPWCRSKHLIRRSMRGELPAAVLGRRKSGLTGDPDYQIASGVGLPPLTPEPELRRFVDPERVPTASGSGMIAFRADFRPRALNYWLANRTAARPFGFEEHAHDVAHA